MGTPYPVVTRFALGKLAGPDCTVVVDGTEMAGGGDDATERHGLPGGPVVTRAGTTKVEWNHVSSAEAGFDERLQVMVEKGLVSIARGGGRGGTADGAAGNACSRSKGFGRQDDLVLAVALAWWWARRAEWGPLLRAADLF
ncbi:MAG: hypothetical protein WKF37_22770 [Bryobacteraceae bacterium]